MATGGGEHGPVANGLMQELQNQPGGVTGLLSTLQQNGAGGLVQQAASGDTSPANPDQIEQGLAGTGIIDNIAQRTGISPTMIKMGLAFIVPVIIHHLVSNGHVTPDGQPTGNEPEPGGLLQSILGKL
jgi:uncharacterized protein YidB (DUF937 family)